MDTCVEVHSVSRSTQKQSIASAAKKKSSPSNFDSSRIDHLTEVFDQVKSQLHARLVTSALDIAKKNEKFRRVTNRCFEHIPIIALCMDSNISEHSHLFDELDEQLSAKHQSIVIKFDSADQCASIQNILKRTKIKLNKVYPEKDEGNSNLYFQFSQFIRRYNELKENEKRSLVFIVPEFESFPMLIFENFITLLSLQIQSISISFVVGLCGGDHSLQRLVSSRVASKLSIDTIYDSSARKYFEYVIKALFLSENEEKNRLTITAEQLNFIDHGYFETYSLAWLEHALKFIVCSENRVEEKSSLNVCLFNAIYVSCNQLPNYPLGRYRSTFYEFYLSNRSIFNDLSLSINSATHQQLDTCLNAFLEHKCSAHASCVEFVRSAKKIFLEQSVNTDEQTLRSVGDRRLNRYREQVLQWFKSICEYLRSTSTDDSTTKLTDGLLRERLLPMPRATYIRELIDTIHCKQNHTPDLALLYRVYAESGTKIPLNDWFESFASSVEEQEMVDDSKDKTILARFVHGLSELDYLGFTKTSLQRSFHATKLTWDS